MNDQRKPQGRPRKFEEAGRPVTTTLPESTLQQLEAINTDRAWAIVKAAAIVTKAGSKQAALVDVVKAFPGHAVIVVGPSKSLRKIDWLRLVEIAPTRFLLVVPSGTAPEALEVAVTDLLEHLAPKETYERRFLSELHRILRHSRHQQDVSKAEIMLLRLK